MLRHKKDSSDELVFDIRRTIILSQYLEFWGMPEYRVVSRPKRGGAPVEVYSFPPSNSSVVHRLATVGTSAQQRADGSLAGWELLFVLPSGLGGADLESVSSYLLDIMAYSLRSDVSFKAGSTIPESKLAPVSWPTRALLIDEPRGEPEALEYFEVGAQQVTLLWVVPVYGIEQQYISKHGIERFDSIVDKSEISIVNINRICYFEERKRIN